MMVGNMVQPFRGGVLMKDTGDLISSLLAAVSDYGNRNFSDGHVERWLEQFPAEHHKVILKELANVLGRSYLSRMEMKRMIGEITADANIFPDSVESVKFMDPRKAEGNQKMVLQMFDEALSEAYGISMAECGKGEVASYIYIDEAIWSGERFVDGLRRWVATFDDLQSIERLDIIVFAVHTRDLDYITAQMERLLPHTRIYLRHFIEFKNRLDDAKKVYEGYWPSSGIGYNEETTDYISRIVKMRSNVRDEGVPILRKSGHPKSDAYFTGAMNRKLVEKLFLEKGVEIVNHMMKPEVYMKPLGYDASRTLGFGSYYISHLNISDHCPLVMWWEEGGWYPLFPRKGN